MIFAKHKQDASCNYLLHFLSLSISKTFLFCISRHQNSKYFIIKYGNKLIYAGGALWHDAFRRAGADHFV